MIDNSGFRANVGILLANQQDQILWAKRLNQQAWQFPQGGLQENETLEDALYRELQEEVGLAAADWQPLLRMHLSNSVTDEEALVYVARGLTHGATAHEDSEDIEVKRLPLQEAIDMALNGEITDAISVAALLKLALLAP